jgi:mono/diheme cytochrome c family protein
MRRAVSIVLGLCVFAVAGIVATLLRETYGHALLDGKSAPFEATAAQIERGEYLARIGNCAGCHTARGGEAYAGGRAIDTPFGSIYASNLTPDKETGIGAWSAGAFYRAMHEGRSRDGRMLYPAFPYPNMTLVTRDDSDAIYAYLVHRVKPASATNMPNTLSFPFNNQVALAAWRLLYFRTGEYQPQTTQSAAWNRGAYLVQGLAHCGACHSTRNALGAPVKGHAYDGAMMPAGDWYAPSLTAKSEASVADWDLVDVAGWLKNGVSARGAALGPMAEVVFQSTQYAATDDLLAMATYLKALPSLEPARPASAVTRLVGQSKPGDLGERVYAKHCKDCHGAQGEGKADAYPALAGNRAVSMANPANVIRVILVGGFAPATAGNPRPHGMPPYYHLLSDAEIGEVATYIRSSWGNLGGAVTALDMIKYRNALGATQ